LSLVRIITALNRGSRALGQVVQRGQLGYVLLLTLIVTLTAAAGGYNLERDEPGANIRTPGDAIWWAATMITTINSPLEPVTLEGRVLGLLLRIFAVSIIGYLTATFAVYLLGNPARGDEQQRSATELQALTLKVERLEQLLEERLPKGPIRQ